MTKIMKEKRNLVEAVKLVLLYALSLAQQNVCNNPIQDFDLSLRDQLAPQILKLPDQFKSKFMRNFVQMSLIKDKFLSKLAGRNMETKKILHFFEINKLIYYSQNYYQNQKMKKQQFADPKTLPPGTYNKGTVIPLTCNCPCGCPCQAQQTRNWYHSYCGDPSFINEYGDIFCRHYRENKECDGYFIQHARFQCDEAQKSKTWQQFNNAAQILMAIAQGMQAAKFSLDDNALVQFETTLAWQVLQRWMR